MTAPLYNTNEGKLSKQGFRISH